jgi:hypothetical protein
MFKSCSAGVLLLVALHGAAAFHMPSALPSARLGSARATASRPSLRTARVPMMSSTPQKERTVRAPVFDEVCEQTGITLSRCVCRNKSIKFVPCFLHARLRIFECLACCYSSDFGCIPHKITIGMICQTGLGHNISDLVCRYMMEVSRQNPEMRDLESLISGIQQVQFLVPVTLSLGLRFMALCFKTCSFS